MTKVTNLKKILAISYCIINCIIFSFHFFAAKDILLDVPPLVFAAYRGILGGLILLVVFRKDIFGNLNLKSLFHLSIIAFLGFFINQIFFMYGLKESTPTNASIIINTIPIATTLMAILFYLESFTWRKMNGILIGFSLALFLALYGKGGSISANVMGDILILLNVLSFCLALTLAKRIMSDNFPHVLLATGMILIGGIFLLVFSVQDTSYFIEYTFRDWNKFGIMFFEVVISTSITYWLNFKALEVLAPSQTTIFIYFQPPITAGLELLLYNKMPSPIIIPVFFGILISGYLVLTKTKTLRNILFRT